MPAGRLCGHRDATSAHGLLDGARQFRMPGRALFERGHVRASRSKSCSHPVNLCEVPERRRVGRQGSSGFNTVERLIQAL